MAINPNRPSSETEYIKQFVKAQQQRLQEEKAAAASNVPVTSSLITEPVVVNDPFVSNQVTIYKDGQVSTAQANKRPGESESELDRKLRDGWSTTKPSGGASGGAMQTSDAQMQSALSIARSLFAFFPESVIRKYAQAWIKYDDTNLALAETRNSSEWKAEFGFLRRPDGSLIMSEAEAMSAKASYSETLKEVGITDTEQFKTKFNDLIAGEVSAAEFQQRVDLVYNQVVDQIPEVERLYRERYGLTIDQPTIFGALVDPDISDKVLRGDIQTLQLQAQASIRGFTQSFARFEELRKAGLTTEAAAQIYETAQPVMSLAEKVGRELDITTLEEAALGDVTSQRRVQRVQAEIQSELGGFDIGAARTTTGEITGLIAD
jgi:hypothetical protein